MRAKLHWAEMNSQQKKRAASEVAGIDSLHLVVVGAPVPPRRQERARAQCLKKLADELRELQVGELVLERRTDKLDYRDRQTLGGLRMSLPKGTAFPEYSHRPGTDVPQLWIADIIAGAVRMHRQGDSQYRDVLAERVYEINVATGCGDA